MNESKTPVVAPNITADQYTKDFPNAIVDRDKALTVAVVSKDSEERVANYGRAIKDLANGKRGIVRGEAYFDADDRVITGDREIKADLSVKSDRSGEYRPKDNSSMTLAEAVRDLESARQVADVDAEFGAKVYDAEKRVESLLRGKK